MVKGPQKHQEQSIAKDVLSDPSGSITAWILDLVVVTVTGLDEFQVRDMPVNPVLI